MFGDGANPFSLTFDTKGNLYSALSSGGFCQNFEGGNCFGAIAELSPPAQEGGNWIETVLHRFNPNEQDPGGQASRGIV